MFGSHTLWKVVLVSGLSIVVVNLFGGTLFDITANFLKGSFADEATIQVSCVAYGIPTSFSEAVELAQSMSEEKIACIRQYFVQENVEL